MLITLLRRKGTIEHYKIEDANVSRYLSNIKMNQQNFKEWWLNNVQDVLSLYLSFFNNF